MIDKYSLYDSMVANYLKKLLLYCSLAYLDLFRYKGMEKRESIIAELGRMGVNVKVILSTNPTKKQLQDLLDGLKRLDELHFQYQYR